MLWLNVQRRQMCTEGPWDRTGLCSIAGGAGEGKQAAGAGRMVSPRLCLVKHLATV